jgi:Ca-activated chloride channel family protein
MTFIWPTMLASLVALPMLIGLYLSMQRRRRRIAASHASFSSGQRLQPGRLRHIPSLLFLLGLTLLLVCMARPQMSVSLPRIEGTVVLVFDVSGSMAAADLEPNRLAAAKAAAIEFVQSQPPGVLIGVVAFSESGLSVQAPTNDQEVILASISRLEPQTGTSLGYGILTALNTIFPESEEAPSDSPKSTPTPAVAGSYGPSLIVLLSDGENTAPPDPFEAAFAAAQRGVRIYSIGIGSPAGVNLEINGFSVHTQLDEVTLEQISGLTGGTYFNAGSSEDLREVYNQIAPELVIKPEKIEITAILAGLSLTILLIGGWLSLIWFGRLP